MRIITGKARGTKLDSLPGEDTRPTAERVKEGVFSAIQFDIEGRKVLDLFGGSGQMALEALSRGARNAVIVDNNRKAAEIIRSNASKTGLFSECRTICSDWRDFIKSAAGRYRFDLVFLDPPYKDGFLDEVIKRVSEKGLLDSGCILVCESGESGIPVPPEGFSARLYRYGKVCVSILQSSGAAKDETSEKGEALKEGGADIL